MTHAFIASVLLWVVSRLTKIVIGFYFDLFAVRPSGDRGSPTDIPHPRTYPSGGGDTLSTRWPQRVTSRRTGAFMAALPQAVQGNPDSPPTRLRRNFVLHGQL
jgi:hypothetical protein